MTINHLPHLPLETIQCIFSHVQDPKDADNFLRAFYETVVKHPAGFLPPSWKASALGGRITPQLPQEDRLKKLIAFKNTPSNFDSTNPPSILFKGVSAMAFLDKEYFVTCSREGALRIRDMKTGLQAQKWITPYAFTALAVTSKGVIIAGSESGHIVFCEKGKENYDTYLFEQSPVKKLAVGPGDQGLFLIVYPHSCWARPIQNPSAGPWTRSIHFPIDQAFEEAPHFAEFAAPNIALISGRRRFYVMTMTPEFKPFMTANIGLDGSYCTAATFMRTDYQGTITPRRLFIAYSNGNCCFHNLETGHSLSLPRSPFTLTKLVSDGSGVMGFNLALYPNTTVRLIRQVIQQEQRWSWSSLSARVIARPAQTRAYTLHNSVFYCHDQGKPKRTAKVCGGDPKEIFLSPNEERFFSLSQAGLTMQEVSLKG